MGITIKELSEISGYSTATISRVIANKENVKESTRKEIESLLIKYNYRTNIMDLREKKINKLKVMIIVGDLDNWYYMELIRMINQIMLDYDYMTLIAYSDNRQDLEEKFLTTAIHEGYAGVIYLNVRGNYQLKNILEEHDFPVVFLNRGIRFAHFNTVCNDNYLGGYRATKYLIDMGHKRIGHCMGSSHSNTAGERFRGYEDAMREHGLVVSKNSVYQGNIDWRSGYSYGEFIACNSIDVTAIFSSSYQMTQGLLDCFKEYGVKVPKDISVISFDETPSTKRAGVTTICADPQKMAKAAIELLLGYIKDYNSETRRVFFEPTLIVRESVNRIH